SRRRVSAARHRRADLLGDRGGRIEEASKLRDAQYQNLHLMLSGDRGIARTSFDECHLTEEVTDPQPGDLGAIHGANGVTAADEEELTSRFALGREDRATGDRNLSAQSGDGPKFRFGAGRK